MTPERRSVVSADRTEIGYLLSGDGPGVVLIQGAGSDATGYRDLAAALTTAFTAIVPDRRGRGISPKSYTADHDIARDVEDVDAIMTATGATRIFGLSSGAMIALEAARTLPSVTHLAVFEPPFLPGGLPAAGVRRLGEQVAAHDLPSALVTALELSGTAPAALRALPRPATRALAAALIAVDGLLPGDRAKQRDLLPGIRFDFHDVSSRDTDMSRFASIRQPTLLLSGTKSPDYLRRGVRDLVGLLPDAAHVELAGLGHDGPWNGSLGGRPDVVAAALHAFLAWTTDRP